MNTRWMMVTAAGVFLAASMGCQGPAARRAATAAKEKEMQDRLSNIENQLTRVNDQLTDIKDRAPLPEAPPLREPAAEKAGPDWNDTPKESRAHSGGAKAGNAKKYIRVPVSVKTVQTALKKAGYNPGSADGVCGEKTIAAVRAFQAKEGLKVDGVVGQATWAKLSAYLR
jgi:murein L,D-transpeptidase YcbB/YkuD